MQEGEIAVTKESIADGTNLILPIPVAAQQGFMILQSGEGKVDPSDGTFARGEPWYSATVREED